MADVKGDKYSTLSGSDTNLTGVRAEDKDNKDFQTLSDTSTMKDGTPNYNAAQAKAPAQQGSAAGERFRSLRSYIDKSKANMAGRIGQGLQQREQAAVGEITKAGDVVNRQIQQLQETQAGASNFGYPGQTPTNTTPAPPTPTGTTSTSVEPKPSVSTKLQEKETFTPEEIANFQRLLKPEKVDFTIPGVSNIGNTVAELGKSATRLGTEQGRFDELRRNLGAGRGYSAGAEQLDQLLLQTQKDESAKLKELQKTVGKDSREQLQGLAANVDAKTLELGQAGVNIKDALTEGLKAAAGDVTGRARGAMEAFKESPEYEKLISGGYTDQEIYDYIREKMGTRDRRNIWGKITGKINLADEDKLLQADNLYGLDPTTITNLITDIKNRATNIGSYDGLISEKDSNILKNLGLLGGSAIPIDSAEDLGYAEGTSIDELRRSALDAVSNKVLANREEYKALEKKKNDGITALGGLGYINKLNEISNLEKGISDAEQNVANKIVQINNVPFYDFSDRKKNYNEDLKRLEADLARIKNEYQKKLVTNQSLFGKDKFPEGGTSALFQTVNSQLQKINNDFETNTKKFRRPK